MSDPRVTLVAEDGDAMWLLASLLETPYEGVPVRILAGYGQSSSIAVAQGQLIDYPDRGLALVFNTATDDPDEVEAQRIQLSRLLAATSPTGWHIALAVPDLAAWAGAEPQLRTALEVDPALRTDFRRLTKLVTQVRASGEFDFQAVRGLCPEYRGLEEFILSHSETRQPAVAR